MNVLRNPTHVTKTLTVPTARVLSSVFVNQDLQEMDQHVSVCLRLLNGRAVAGSMLVLCVD